MMMKPKPMICEHDRRLLYPVARLAGKGGKMLVASDPRTAARARERLRGRSGELAFEQYMEKADRPRSRFLVIAKSWCRSL